MKSVTDLGSGPPPRYTGSADPRSHPSRAALEHHLRFFPNCFFFFFVASLAFRGVVGSVVERHRHEVRRAHPKIPAHPSPASLTQGTPLKESQSWAVRMGRGCGEGLDDSCPFCPPASPGCSEGPGGFTWCTRARAYDRVGKVKEGALQARGRGRQRSQEQKGETRAALSQEVVQEMLDLMPEGQRWVCGGGGGAEGGWQEGKRKSRAPQGQESPDL